MNRVLSSCWATARWQQGTQAVNHHPESPTLPSSSERETPFLCEVWGAKHCASSQVSLSLIRSQVSLSECHRARCYHQSTTSLGMLIAISLARALG